MNINKNIKVFLFLFFNNNNNKQQINNLIIKLKIVFFIKHYQTEMISCYFVSCLLIKNLFYAIFLILSLIFIFTLQLVAGLSELKLEDV